MQSGIDARPEELASRLRIAAVLILIALGYALTFYVFYPGIMTLDARFIYNDMLKHSLGDWQSPVMVLLCR